MSAFRSAAAIDADYEEVDEQRRVDRRQHDRRAGRMRLDPLFAAVLLRHVSEAQTLVAPRTYERDQAPTAKGRRLNVRA